MTRDTTARALGHRSAGRWRPAPALRCAVLLAASICFCLVVAASEARAGDISRVRVEEKDSRVVIKYNLAKAKTGYKRTYDLTLSATFTDSTRRMITPHAIDGAVGRDLAPDRGREITWKILDDLEHYDVYGDVEIRLDATVNRWALRHFRRTRAGFEFATNLLFETDLEFRRADPQADDETVELNQTTFSLANNGVRGFVSYLFPSGRSAEVGIGWGTHRSEVSAAGGEPRIPQAQWVVLDGRVHVAGVWLGLGIGKYDFGDAFADLPRGGSAPKYWYYEFSLGGKWRLGRAGSILAELRQGRQILGELEDGGDLLARVRAIRLGYSVDFMDLRAAFGSDEWEPLPPEETSEIGRLTGVSIRRELPLPEVEGLEFAYVPSGFYYVGTPISEARRDSRSESPPFSVYVDGFYVSTTEVTQEAYRALVDREWTRYAGAALPAHGVSFEEATSFCEELTETDRNFEWSLPSEAEWEIASRGGLHPHLGPVASTDSKERERAAEDSDAAELVMMRHAWFRANKVGSGPQPVQGKRPNVLGLYDVHGNVAEWCRRAEPFRWSLDQPGRQPIRGGSITSDYQRCRAGARALEPSESRKASIGFRLICRPRR